MPDPRPTNPTTAGEACLAPTCAFTPRFLSGTRPNHTPTTRTRHPHPNHPDNPHAPGTPGPHPTNPTTAGEACLAPPCAFTPRFLSGTPNATHRRSVGVGRAGLCGLAELEFCEAGV